MYLLIPGNAKNKFNINCLCGFYFGNSTCINFQQDLNYFDETLFLT